MNKINYYSKWSDWVLIILLLDFMCFWLLYQRQTWSTCIKTNLRIRNEQELTKGISVSVCFYKHFSLKSLNALRGCNEMMCMDNSDCQSVETVKYMAPLQMLSTSHCPRAIEAACTLLHHKVYFNGLTREVLFKGKARYSWPHCNN
jgi:hypothetical protein